MANLFFLLFFFLPFFSTSPSSSVEVMAWELRKHLSIYPSGLLSLGRRDGACWPFPRHCAPRPPWHRAAVGTPELSAWVKEGSLPSNTLTPQTSALGRIDPQLPRVRRPAWKRKLLFSSVDHISQLSRCLGCPWVYLWFWKVAKARSQRVLKPAAWCHRRAFVPDAQPGFSRRPADRISFDIVSLGCCPFGSFALTDGFGFESRTLHELKAARVLWGCLCCQDSLEIRVGPFPACGYMEAHIPGNSCVGLTPSSSRAVGTCGRTMWGFMSLHEGLWLTRHKCCHWQWPWNLHHYSWWKPACFPKQQLTPCFHIRSLKRWWWCWRKEEARQSSPGSMHFFSLKNHFKDLAWAVSALVWNILQLWLSPQWSKMLSQTSQ